MHHNICWFILVEHFPSYDFQNIKVSDLWLQHLQALNLQLVGLEVDRDRHFLEN